MEPPHPWSHMPQSRPQPSPDSEVLSKIIQMGNLQEARDFFDKVFWESRSARPEWSHLKTALLNRDKPMMRLLISWGAGFTDKELEQFRDDSKSNYPMYVNILRQCGLRVGLLPLEEKKAVPAANPEQDNVSLSNFQVRLLSGDRDIDIEVDGRVTLFSREWWKVLRAFQKNGAEEAVIAGGALRDFYGKKPVKDVDIFLKSRGNDSKNKTFIEKAFAATNLEVIKQVENPGTYAAVFKKFPDPKTEKMVRKIEDDYWGGSSTQESELQSWRVLAGPDKTEYNIIFVSGVITEASGLNFARRVIESFDFGLCQIATDGKDIITTPLYQEDVSKKKIRLAKGNESSPEHLERIMKKYPEWDICDESKKILFPPSREKPQLRGGYGTGRRWGMK